MPNFRVEHHRTLEEIAAEWEEFGSRLGCAPFMRPGWLDAWWRSFGAGKLQITAVRRGDELVALVPLARRRGVLAAPVNWHTPMFSPLSIDASMLEKLIMGLLDRPPRRLDLGFVPAVGWELPTTATIARVKRMSVECRTSMRSPFVRTRGDWEGFLGRLPTRRVSKYRRFRRRLGEEGEVVFEVADGRERLDGLLAEGFAIEGSGWKREGGTAVTSSPRTLTFYSEVARWAARQGILRLWFLRLDNKAIAFALCLEDGRALYELKVGYDPAWARFGPGVLLTQARIEHAFRSDLERYEFLGQPDRHKLDWTATCHEYVRLQAFGGGLGQIDRLAWTHGRGIALRARELAHRN
ncbi:MAG: GNAT family N-acetyltransferase [Solirubrobacterales bacterium]|nr:GNAT family N-acetyltransferase [Solirubrobacterales bacterium]